MKRFIIEQSYVDIPSEAILRQRMDNNARAFLPIVEKASRDFLINTQPTLNPLYAGHIPPDADVTPMDNTGSHKEGVSRTCKGCDGYTPMPVHLGQEGYSGQVLQTTKGGRLNLPQ